jgi:hypothetical protein
MENYLHIFRKQKGPGVEIKIKQKKYLIDYPRRIWNKFPVSLHKSFADSLAYVATWHLPLAQNCYLTYHFSHPLIEPAFFKILVYSMPCNSFDYPDISTADLIKKFYNCSFKTQFKALNYHYAGKRIKKILKNRAILLFSFGKESLLTYGLLRELNVSVTPFFMKEPQASSENRHKLKLAEKFLNKIGGRVNFFPLSVGRLRQKRGFYWGWDIILSQYAFFLVPFLFYHQARYLFIGNEQSCNYCLKDNEGYFINPVFEQSVPVMQLLQDIPKLFSINTHVGSLVEPVHEIFITAILHRRYPDLGKFQMSCFSETPQAKKHRWCGHCEKCSRMFIFFKALGINTDKIGFYNNSMLATDKKQYYVLFNSRGTDSAYGSSGLGRDEQLLAFYLAYRNGVKGDLIREFKQKYLTEAEKKKQRLVKEFFGIHSSYSLPSSLRRRVLNIYAKEQAAVMKTIT